MATCNIPVKKEKNGVFWLEFPLLSAFPNLKHAVFLRHGGVSNGPYSSLNVADHVGDEISDVYANRKKIKTILKADFLTISKQVHGKTLREVKTIHDTKNLTCDGMMTTTPGMALAICHADCQAVILYDPVNHAAAAVHSGWRGSVQNIYALMVEQMRKTYGTTPENLHAAISPSLGPTAAEFINFRQELPESFWEFQVTPNHFDFWEISRLQLKKSGLLANHIELAGICTKSNPDDYFSYRRDKITGRHATAVLLE